MNYELRIKVYGCRGSVAISRFSRYGGNTSCMTVCSGGEMLVIDAGSGLMVLQEELLGAAEKQQPPVNILLSHLHLDHIIGLSVFGQSWEKGVGIYTCSRDERPLNEQIFGAFSPPYWPVAMGESAVAKCNPIEAGVPFSVGVFTVTPFEASHPDKTVSYHITDGRNNFVHLLDSEVLAMKKEEAEILASHCRGADLVVFDALFSPQDYPKHKGWGHSTVEHGVELAREWGCRRMMFSHFHQKYSDAELDDWKSYFSGDCDFILAHDGLELEI